MYVRRNVVTPILASRKHDRTISMAFHNYRYYRSYPVKSPSMERNFPIIWHLSFFISYLEKSRKLFYFHETQ